MLRSTNFTLFFLMRNFSMSHQKFWGFFLAGNKRFKTLPREQKRICHVEDNAFNLFVILQQL